MPWRDTRPGFCSEDERGGGEPTRGEILFATRCRGARRSRARHGSAAAYGRRGPGVSGKTSGRLVAVDHPRDAETVDAHAEPGGPERLPDRHGDGAFFRQRLEDAFRLGRI